MEKIISALGKKIYCRFLNEELLEKEIPLLIFLHEGLGTSAQWKDFPKHLTEMIPLPVLMYDRYGYGKSERFEGERQPTYMEFEAEEFLPEILKKLNLDQKKIILFGHSDGGSIAMFFASFFPEKVIAAVIEAPHFFLDEISYSGINNAVHLYENSSLRKKLEKYHGINTDPMFRSWTNILLSLEMQNWNTLPLLRNVKCPVLAIQGTDDEFGTLKQIETLKEYTSGSVELLIIEGCGHIPHHQARKQVSDTTVDFLSRYF